DPMAQKGSKDPPVIALKERKLIPFNSAITSFLAPNSVLFMIWQNQFKEVVYWDIVTGQEVRRLSYPLGVPPEFAMATMRLTPDRQKVLISSERPKNNPGFPFDAPIQIMECQTGKTVLLPGHQNVMMDYYFYPDSKRALSWSFDQTMRLWDLEAGKSLRVY